jgi:membrane protein YdbS with pleckstrin-like domain
MTIESKVASRSRLEYGERPAWRVQWPLFLALFLALGLTWLAAGTLHHGLGAGKIHERVMLAVPLTLAVIAGLILLYRRYSWRFSISDGRIESRHGILAVDLHSIRLRDLRSITLKQSAIQRIFLVGTLEFSSAAGGGVEVLFWGISRPKRVKRLTQRLECEEADRSPEPARREDE